MVFRQLLIKLPVTALTFIIKHTGMWLEEVMTNVTTTKFFLARIFSKMWHFLACGCLGGIS